MSSFMKRARIFILWNVLTVFWMYKKIILDATVFDECTLAFGEQSVEMRGESVGQQFGKYFGNAVNKTYWLVVFHFCGVHLFGRKKILAEFSRLNPCAFMLWS